MKKMLFFLLINIILLLKVHAESVKVPGGPQTTTLPQELLKTLISRAGLEIAYPYDAEDHKMITAPRLMNDVNTGALDVFWMATTSELEQDYLALFYPIYRGMLGMRIGIVRHDNTEVFSGVKTLSELQILKAGSGTFWADTEILEYNGLAVVKTLKYGNMFPMLEGGRFDYFPRGIHEPWQEIENFAELNLVVEPNLLINYKMPMYYFINKENRALGKKLSAAFEEIIADGTFEKMFFNDMEVRNALKKSNVENRHLIELINPFLSESTPVNRKELWFDPRAGE